MTSSEYIEAWQEALDKRKHQDQARARLVARLGLKGTPTLVALLEAAEDWILCHQPR